MTRTLVIGGTGPTGIHLVRGLTERGHEVVILHRGTHERPETPVDIEHIHADPYEIESLAEAIGDRTWDLTVVMYGRLRRIAEFMVGRTGRFVSVGGVPAIRGWMNPWLFSPEGLPVPARESDPVVAIPEEDEKGYRVARTEEFVFGSHPKAAHFRYPYAYGPLQVVPREWSIVRRILDGRGQIVVADDGLTLHHHGYTENLAHAVLCGIDQPAEAAGLAFNCGDDEVLSVRQIIEIIAVELGAELEIVSMPFEIALPARPLLAQPSPTHRVLDTSLLRTRLGYRDLVPAREAVARTARWLIENPIAPGAPEEFVLTDPFDYAAEDHLIESWKSAIGSMKPVAWPVMPGVGLAYSGPGGRPRSQPTFEK
ncbi:MAG: NAD-dependent epimerase/dehydratase family protein [Acidimicrobiales bacterium]